MTTTVYPVAPQTYAPAPHTDTNFPFDFPVGLDDDFYDDIHAGFPDDPSYGDLWFAGSPTEYGIEVFTEGDCWALAWYVAKATGGRLATLGWPGWEHVVVQVGPDEYLDATGMSTRRMLADIWQLPVVPMDMTGIRAFLDYEDSLDGGFKYPITHDAVAKFADLLVGLHLPDRVGVVRQAA